MRSGGSTVRQFGQRPLPPPFLPGAKSLANEGTVTRPSNKLVSLSDFLDRKLGKGKPGIASRSVQEKQCCFSSACPVNDPRGVKSAEVGKSSALDGAFFRKFNPTVKGEGCIGSSGGGEVGEESQSASRKDGIDSRKRKNPFLNSSAEDLGTTPSKLLLVLGDDPKPRQKRREYRFRDDKEKPPFNHYANGSGWWDGDQEGVDSEEVGCNDMWEGMGSTTLGGLEWH